MEAKTYGKSADAGFTVLEVVLAIGLCCTLLALLATAIDLYLVRFDANRSKVEAAQLARTLLDGIANDIRATRYFNPNQNQQNSTDGNRSTSVGTLDSEESRQVLGVFGTATELRLDRTARWNWLRTAREIGASEPTAPGEMPLSISYVFNDGQRLLTDQLAAMGVRSDTSLSGYAGLYRNETPTPAWIYQSASSGVSSASLAQLDPELLAPEVLSLEFAYFDGTQMLDSWDSADQQGLPVGIEIRLTVLMEPYDLAMSTTSQQREAILQSAENSVDFRLFVALPLVEAPQSASQVSTSNDSTSPTGQGGSGNGS